MQLTHLQQPSMSMHWQAEFCRFIYDRTVEAAEGAAGMYGRGRGSIADAIRS